MPYLQGFEKKIYIIAKKLYFGLKTWVPARFHHKQIQNLKFIVFHITTKRKVNFYYATGIFFWNVDNYITNYAPVFNGKQKIKLNSLLS